MSLLSKNIPSQHIGSKTGATAKCHTLSSEEAQILFNKAKERLLAINGWFELCEKNGAEFHLTDSRGIKLNSCMPEIGDLMRIKLPAPRNTKGDGFDWVRIEKFEQIKVQTPTKNYSGFGYDLLKIHMKIHKTVRIFIPAMPRVLFYFTDIVRPYMLLNVGEMKCLIQTVHFQIK